MRPRIDNTIANKPDQTLTHRLRTHVELLAGAIGERNVLIPEALRRAAVYIEDEWSTLGYGVERHEYDVSGIHCANLVATREGHARESEILLLGAHYDSVIGSPGANDNASGVAALLEISRMFQTLEPALTIRFVAFVNEEPPFFWTRQQGSMVYAQAVRRRGDDIRLMASLETIGCYNSEPGSQSYPPLFRLFYPDRGNFIGIVSDFRSKKAMHRLATAFRGQSDFPLQSVSTFRFIPGVAWSDHHSFWRQGYPAVMVTDTALYRYRHYHAATDTSDKLAYPELAQVTLGLFKAFAILAREGVGLRVRFGLQGDGRGLILVVSGTICTLRMVPLVQPSTGRPLRFSAITDLRRLPPVVVDFAKGAGVRIEVPSSTPRRAGARGLSCLKITMR